VEVGGGAAPAAEGLDGEGKESKAHPRAAGRILHTLPQIGAVAA
jgi:hypothetical protein